MTDEFFQQRLAAMRALEQRASAAVQMSEYAAIIAMFVVLTVLHIEGELTGTSFGVVGAAFIVLGLVVSRAVGSLVRQHHAERIEREYPLGDEQ